MGKPIFESEVGLLKISETTSCIMDYSTRLQQQQGAFRSAMITASSMQLADSIVRQVPILHSWMDSPKMEHDGTWDIGNMMKYGKNMERRRHRIHGIHRWRFKIRTEPHKHKLTTATACPSPDASSSWPLVCLKSSGISLLFTMGSHENTCHKEMMRNGQGLLP